MQKIYKYILSSIALASFFTGSVLAVNPVVEQAQESLQDINRAREVSSRTVQDIREFAASRNRAAMLLESDFRAGHITEEHHADGMALLGEASRLISDGAGVMHHAFRLYAEAGGLLSEIIRTEMRTNDQAARCRELATEIERRVGDDSHRVADEIVRLGHQIRRLVASLRAS